MNGVLTFDNTNDVSYAWGFRDITDGSSNTIAVGEATTSQDVRVDNTGDGNFPLWAGGNNTGGCDMRQVGSVLRFANGTFFINRQTESAGGANEPELSFRSQHAGGAQFLMGDGSVTFISENIDTNVYTYLGGLNDGQPASLP